MATLHITFDHTPYTNERANSVLSQLGAPKSLLRVNQDRAQLVQESVLLGSRMRWGERTETSLALVYTGALPKGVARDLNELVVRGVITSWGKVLF